MKGTTKHQFELDDFHRNISDDDLITDLVRVSDDPGRRKVTFREYNAKGKFNSSTIAARFGSWNTASVKAGLEKTFERNAPNEALFRNLVGVWNILQRHTLIDLADGETHCWSLLSGQTMRMFQSNQAIGQT